jgi:hypothetical protein
LRDRKRKDVFINGRIACDKGVPTDPYELIEAAHAADFYVILENHVTRKLGRIRDDHVIADVTIVRNMRV